MKKINGKSLIFLKPEGLCQNLRRKNALSLSEIWLLKKSMFFSDFQSNFCQKSAPDHMSGSSKILLGRSEFLSDMSDGLTKFREHCEGLLKSILVTLIIWSLAVMYIFFFYFQIHSLLSNTMGTADLKPD